MAASDKGDTSPTPDDLRRGSIVSNADDDDFESAPGTPTPGNDDNSAREGKGDGKGASPTKEKGEDGDAGAGEGKDSNPHVAPAASTSSLHLPLSDPQPNLDPPSASTDELVASLRGQITDLSSQVSSLNNKLVKSYTTRGELEDDLHDRIELQRRLTARVAELEADKQRWTKEIEAGGWVEKSNVQSEMQRLMNTVMEETKNRETAVKAHSALETEIENLTSNLFTEANKMVAFERLARARAEEKTRSVEEAGVSMQALLEEVQEGLKDTIIKLEKRDAEVADLKKRLAAHGEHVEEDVVEGQETAEGDVGGIMFSDGEHLTPLDTKGLKPSMSGAVTPSHLSAPRLLTSVLPYHEFLAFITYLRQLRVSALSRPLESAGYPHPMLSGRDQAHHHFSPAQLLAPHLLLSTHLSQPFLKRCVEEDSDPALRLDLAPGLGFLSRRTVGTAIVDGSLLIEPLHAALEFPSEKCALCGCSLEMWLPNSGHINRVRPSTNANAATQTMRKMLGSSLFSRSNSSSGTSFSNPQPSSSSSAYSSSSTAPSSSFSHSASSSTDSFTWPPPQEKASHHPHDGELRVHLFRANDTSAQRYPVCPSYCLARLRAVCEFWTYVRVIERGLLLEEGFRFVQGRDGSGNVTPALSRQASFVRGGSAPPVGGAGAGASGAATPTTEKGPEGLGLGPVGEGEHSDVQALDFEAEDTEDGAAPKTPRIVEPEEKDVGDEAVEEKKEDGEGDEKKKESSSTSSTPELPGVAKLTQNANSSSSSLSKPARPARSSARNSPAIGSNPSPPASPSLPSSSAPSLPPRRPAAATPAPPPRHPSASHAAPDLSASLSSSSTSAAPGAAGDLIANAIGWEDRCWSEVVRLKESVFWARVAAIAPDGAAVSSRGARVWIQ
ncbi:hypothetical protein JCM8097_006990 [Rhodosporidiobolus ruineniae]